MKTKIFFMLCLPIFFSGCFMGELGIYGSARQEYLKSIKSMRDFWIKEGASESDRAQDWVACGGAKNGNFSPYEKTLNAEQRADEKNFIDAYYRLLHNVQRCMRTKGYLYTGKCKSVIDAEVTPACGGP